MNQIQNMFPPFIEGVRGIFWKFVFGYYLLFVNWCLNFSQFKF